MPFAVPAMSPLSRPLKGSMPPSAHLLGAMGMPTTAYPLAQPAGYGAPASDAAMGQGVMLQHGREQHMAHLTDSRSSSHLDGLSATQSTGSHQVGDRSGAPACTNSHHIARILMVTAHCETPVQARMHCLL